MSNVAYLEMMVAQLSKQVAALQQQSHRQYLRHINGEGVAKLVLVDDSGSAQKMQVRMPMGELIDAVPNTQQFGFASNMPPKGDVSITFLEGNRSKALVTATGHQDYRPRNLGVGTTVVHDAAGQYIVLAGQTLTVHGNGTIILQAAAKVRVEAPVLECTGEVVAMCDGAAIHLSTHLHSEVQRGPADTGMPVPGS